MNGERLVAEAAKLISKGESYYHQAAEKIEQAAERGIPNTEIAVGLARSEAWVRALRNWHAQGSQSTTTLPFSEPQGAVAHRHARSVLRESTLEQVQELVASLPREAVEKMADAVYKTQVDTLRKESDEPDSKLQPRDYQDAKARFEEIHSSSTLEMDELFTALSRVRVKGVEKVVANASVKQRREWGERLPEEIALLQLALDLCRTQKLEAVR